MRRSSLAVLAVISMMAGVGVTSASAQGLGYGDDDQDYRRAPPPPPPNYRSPEDFGGPGYGGPPRPRFGDPYGEGRPPPRGGPLVCRTEEGSCRTRGPQYFRARCSCDFGDGAVPGRMKP